MGGTKFGFGWYICGMKTGVKRQFGFLLILIMFSGPGQGAAQSSTNGKTDTLNSVIVGDSLLFYTINQDKSTQQCFGEYNVKWTHHEGRDFFIFLPANQSYESIDAPIVFAPKKIGVQSDTFNLTADWIYRICGIGSTRMGPYYVTARGVSDSVILFRAAANPGAVVTYFIVFNWNKDSNRYIPDGPLPFEIVNNVEDETTFDISARIDSAAHIRPIIVLGGDSTKLSYSYKAGSQIRSKRGLVYLFSDAQGFVKDTILPAKLIAYMVNTTTLDTAQVNYQLLFKAKPIERSDFHQSINIFDLQILFSVHEKEISISTNSTQGENAILELYDALGRIQPLPNSQLFIPSGTGTQKLDVGNLPSGCYILRLKTKDQVFSKSFVYIR